jgi:hypothetical protein
MDLQEVVQRFQYYDGELPREALRAATAQQDAITPELLTMLGYARACARPFR